MVLTQEELNFLVSALWTYRKGDATLDEIQKKEYKDSLLSGLAVAADPKDSHDFKTVKSLITKANLLVCNDDELLFLSNSLAPLLNFVRSSLDALFAYGEEDIQDKFLEGSEWSEYRDMVNELCGWVGTDLELTSGLVSLPPLSSAISAQTETASVWNMPIPDIDNDAEAEQSDEVLI